MRLYVDNAKCSGCRACLVACSLDLFKENNPKKAALRLIRTCRRRACSNEGLYAVRRMRSRLPDRSHQKERQGRILCGFSRVHLVRSVRPGLPEEVMFVRAELADTAWKCDLCGDCVSVCGMSALWIAEEQAA